MVHPFSDTCGKLCDAIGRYIAAELTEDKIYYSYSEPPNFAKTTVTSDVVALPNTGFPIRGTEGTETRWERHRSDKWLARERAWLALSDEGDRAYIPATVPYQAIVKSLQTAYADLAVEIVSDFVLAARLFESMGYKHYEPEELTNLGPHIVDQIGSRSGWFIVAMLIGEALVGVGYVDSERLTFSSWSKAAEHLAERLKLLSTRTHHDYTIAVLLNAPLVDSTDAIEIGTLYPYGAPAVLHLGYATDEILSKTSRSNPHAGTVNTVLTLSMRVGVNEPVEKFLATYLVASHLAQRVVDILRLVSADDIGVLGVEIINGDSMTPTIRKAWENTYQQDLSAFYPRRFRFSSPTGSALTEQQIETIQRLATRYIEQETTVSGWEIAIRRFRDMYERHTPDDPELILAMAIAFEALYLSEADDSKHELSYRLRLRAARLLRNSVQEREGVFNILRDLYHFRSRVAHGSSIESLKDAERKKLIRVLAECPGLLKETLLAVLNGRGPWNHSDEKQGQEWRKIELA
jgi:hypothetical protein